MKLLSIFLITMIMLSSLSLLLLPPTSTKENPRLKKIQAFANKVRFDQTYRIKHGFYQGCTAKLLRKQGLTFEAWVTCKDSDGLMTSMNRQIEASELVD